MKIWRFLPLKPSRRMDDYDEVYFHCGSAPDSESSGSTEAHAQAFVSCQSDLLWKDEETIVYSFCNGDDIQKKKVETTIQKWAECVNLTFQLEHDPSKPSNIRISFENKGNWTKIVGRNEVAEIGSTTMNLGAVNSTSETITPSEQGVILHEWGHVLGLYHEHQRPGSEIVWRKDPTMAHYRLHYPNFSDKDLKDWVHINIFNMPSRSNYGKFDADSIMIYHIPKTCYDVKPGGWILPLRPNNDLSASDMAYMAINYPKKSDDWSTSPAQIALRKLNIPPNISKEWNHSNVRAMFWEYVKENWGCDIHIVVHRQPASESTSDNKKSFEVSIKTNLPGFKPESCVRRTYSQFRNFSSQLQKKAPKWKPLPLPLFPFGMSKWQALHEFVEKIDAKTIRENSEFGEAVRKFLQDEGAEDTEARLRAKL